jgi:cation diffusion facilitator CzcD-associated flavoprotein CzcO
MEIEVVVIGAGQAGLSAAYFLRRAGFAPETGFVVLDANAAPGGAWQHRWPSLRFGTAHRVYSLPGLPLTGADETAPEADVVAGYFAE